MLSSFRHGLCRVILLGVLTFAAGCASPLPPKGAVSAWRVGPLLEGVRTESGDHLLAIRPFYSHEEAMTEPFRRVTDVLWPVGMFQHRGERRSWRLFPFHGSGDDAPEADDTYRFRLLPIYFEGRTRGGENYRALFPLCGEIQEFIGLGHVRFVLFPLYGSADEHGTRTTTFLWPFYLTRQGRDIDQLRLWPFYGERTLTGRHAETRHFVLWPFWSDVHMTGESIQGDGFVLFPIYGHSRFERRKRGWEEGWTVLPPFFSYVHGQDGYRSLRAPWPFIRQLDDADQHQRHWWPFYGATEREGYRDWYAIWPIISGSQAELPEVQVNQFAVTPLYFQETRVKKPVAEGAPPTVVDRYRRLWPLFSWQRNEAGMQLRIPELTFFRRSAPIERNWAPFWSLFVRRERADGARVTDVLWGLAAWGRDADARGFVQLLWALRFHPSRGKTDAATDVASEAGP
jgi:hypothetical protein